ncbi:4Fe-4S double cluster binding domain-containing protein [Candidatus Bipolaricaulota bacterium]
MNRKDTAGRMLRAIAEQGWMARLVPAERRFDLWSELEERIVHGELDEELVNERFTFFRKSITEAPDWIRSILLVAIPDPAMRIRFAWQGREVPVIVPPTFIHLQERGEPGVQAVLEEHVGKETIRTEAAAVPKKLLATRTGMARYGRNNITYIEGLGSYYRLCALFTDVSCDEDSWYDPKVLDSCESCGACVRVCPVGAIDPVRFLVRAERCITYWQEKPGDVPFPEELDPSWPDQFVGCMRCQAVCPHNQGLLKVEEAGPPFSEEETKALLRGATINELAEETVDKLKQHDILGYLDVLPRNLLVALGNSV